MDALTRSVDALTRSVANPTTFLVAPTSVAILFPPLFSPCPGGIFTAVLGASIESGRCRSWGRERRPLKSASGDLIINGQITLFFLLIAGELLTSRLAGGVGFAVPAGFCCCFPLLTVGVADVGETPASFLQVVDPCCTDIIRHSAASTWRRKPLLAFFRRRRVISTGCHSPQQRPDFQISDPHVPVGQILDFLAKCLSDRSWVMDVHVMLVGVYALCLFHALVRLLAACRLGVVVSSAVLPSDGFAISGDRWL
ncbi:hypothetical protein ACLOJK_004842 [Asimina triloba]